MYTVLVSVRSQKQHGTHNYLESTHKLSVTCFLVHRKHNMTKCCTTCSNKPFMVMIPRMISLTHTYVYTFDVVCNVAAWLKCSIMDKVASF